MILTFLYVHPRFIICLTGGANEPEREGFPYNLDYALDGNNNNDNNDDDDSNCIWLLHTRKVCPTVFGF